jgi:DNA invertase Pin-like site-specific DNA recombinase
MVSEVGRSTKAVIYARVSTTDQSPDNQILALAKWAKGRGFTIAEVYQESESAWRNGHQHELAKLLNDLESGRRKVDVCLVWSLDRLTRGGIDSLLTLYNRFNQYGCKLISMTEGFTEVPNQFTPIFLAMIGFFAQWESGHRSERTLAGLARARAEAPGGKLKVRGSDKKKRRRAGYLLRYVSKSSVGQNVPPINATKSRLHDDTLIPPTGNTMLPVGKVPSGGNLWLPPDKRSTFASAKVRPYSKANVGAKVRPYSKANVGAKVEKVGKQRCGQGQS